MDGRAGWLVGADARTLVEGVESFRTKVLHLLSQIRPVIEHEAKVSLADWTDRLAAEPQVQRRAA